MPLSVISPRPTPTISGVTQARPGTISGVTQARPPLLSLYTPPSVTPPAPPQTFAPPQTYAPPVPAIVRPPRLDIAATQAKARKQAEGAVNPFYTKQLNDFLAQQAAQRQQQQTAYDTSVKNLQDQLTETLKSNEITGKRTTEDVAQNQADINQGADVFQTDTGQAADAARIAQARELAQSGLTGGLGAQQKEAATTQRNTAEKRQEQEFQKNRQEQELFKTRTFEDLARSGELATKATAKGKKAAKFDLDVFIKNQGFQEKSTRQSLEQQRLEAIQRDQQTRQANAYAQYLAGIRDPAQLLAAQQLYGGVF